MQNINNQSSTDFSGYLTVSQACSQPLRLIGFGVLGGFGVGLAHLEEALDGTRLKKIEMTTHQLIDGPVEIPVMRADTSSLENYVSKRSLRRIDHYSRMAALGACLALEDADRLEKMSERTGLIIVSGYGASATTFSFLDSVIKDGDTCASPTHFSNSVHNSAAAHISILLNITGPSLTISQFNTSVASGLLTARQWLAEGRVDEVLLGAVDEYCPVRGYSNLRLPCSAGPVNRNDKKMSEPEVLGEGAAFLLLSRDIGDDFSYPKIIDVQQGNIDYDCLAWSRNDLIILEDMQNRSCERIYNKLHASKLCAGNFSHIYGRLPVGQAFDLVIAVLMIRNRKIYPCINLSNHSSTMVDKLLKNDPERIACLAVSKRGEYGAVILANND
jgi:3-oxoacyl-[acyl-carrier-protein] synthase II